MIRDAIVLLAGLGVVGQVLVLLIIPCTLSARRCEPREAPDRYRAS